MCAVDISVSRGGRQDITSHIATTKRASYAWTQCRQSVLSLAVMTRCLIGAEMLLTGPIVEHNLPVAFAKHFGQLLHRTCLDSKDSSEI